MTLTAPDPGQAGAESQLATAAVSGVLRFISALRPLESVQRIAYSVEGHRFHIWVLQREENLEEARQIRALADDSLYEADRVPIQLHVVPLSEVDERALPPVETVVER